jgi:hypothetical protein
VINYGNHVLHVVYCNHTKRKGVLPTTQNYRTPDADLSDPDLLFYLQTSELNNTWWTYWFLQLHSTNQLHTTHTRTESKSQTSIHCLPTLSNTPFSAENISHYIADYLHAESTSSLLGILDIPDLPVTTYSLSLSPYLDFCSKTTILGLPGAAENLVSGQARSTTDLTLSPYPSPPYCSSFNRPIDLSPQKLSSASFLQNLPIYSSMYITRSSSSTKKLTSFFWTHSSALISCSTKLHHQASHLQPSFLQIINPAALVKKVDGGINSEILITDPDTIEKSGTSFSVTASLFFGKMLDGFEFPLIIKETKF